MSKTTPAFPVVQPNGTMLVDYGMSKREYIAIKAMEALIAGGRIVTVDLLVARAYEYADAMEKEGRK